MLSLKIFFERVNIGYAPYIHKAHKNSAVLPAERNTVVYTVFLSLIGNNVKMGAYAVLYPVFVGSGACEYDRAVIDIPRLFVQFPVLASVKFRNRNISLHAPNAVFFRNPVGICLRKTVKRSRVYFHNSVLRNHFDFSVGCACRYFRSIPRVYIISFITFFN